MFWVYHVRIIIFLSSVAKVLFFIYSHNNIITGYTSRMSFLRAAMKKNIKKQENSQINKKPNQEPKEIQNPGKKSLNLVH